MAKNKAREKREQKAREGRLANIEARKEQASDEYREARVAQRRGNAAARQGNR